MASYYVTSPYYSKFVYEPWSQSKKEASISIASYWQSSSSGRTKIEVT